MGGVEIYQGSRVALVIPAHNEEAHIRAVVDGVPSFVDFIIVVDDASVDLTSASAASSDRNPIVLRREVNGGVGSAVMDGYLKAVSLGADVVARIDGDGQMDTQELPLLLDPVVTGRVGFAKGNRFKQGRIPSEMPFMRQIGNIGLTFFTKLASGYWHVFDPQNGYSAISSAAIEVLDVEYLRRCGYFFENGLLIELNCAEVPVLDVPTATIYANEISGISIPRVALTFPLKLIRGTFRRFFRRYVVRDFSPVALFVVCGGLLFFGGLTWGITEWVRSVSSGVPSSVGAVMLAALPMLAGFELLLQGLVLDINGSPR